MNESKIHSLNSRSPLIVVRIVVDDENKLDHRKFIRQISRGQVSSHCDGQINHKKGLMNEMIQQYLR